MSTYTDLAPLISETGIKQTAIDTYFDKLPEQAEPKALPTITKAKCVAIADKYFEDGKMSLEKHNGFTSVAQEIGLTTGQVQSIVKEIGKLHSAWASANLEIMEK